MIENHRKMLNDAARNQAFYAALKKHIRPQHSTVLDIGSGTGFLSFLAQQLGAKDCYLVEHGPVSGLAEQLAKDNGIKHCHFIQQHSSHLKVLPKVDILVSETLGNFATEENIIENIEDARQYLKPNAIIIPKRLEQYIAPIVSARFYEDLCSWDKLGHNLNFTAAKQVSFNNIYVRTIRPADLWSAPGAAQCWDQIDFRTKNLSQRKATIKWKFDDISTIYGFALWWQCELSTDIHISTHPQDPMTHWEQVYLPIPEPIHLAASDHLQCILKCDTHRSVGINLKWTVTAKNSEGRTLKQLSLDLNKGFV